MVKYTRTTFQNHSINLEHFCLGQGGEHKKSYHIPFESHREPSKKGGPKTDYDYNKIYSII